MNIYLPLKHFSTEDLKLSIFKEFDIPPRKQLLFGLLQENDEELLECFDNNQKVLVVSTDEDVKDYAGTL